MPQVSTPQKLHCHCRPRYRTSRHTRIFTTIVNQDATDPNSPKSLLPLPVGIPHPGPLVSLSLSTRRQRLGIQQLHMPLVKIDRIILLLSKVGITIICKSYSDFCHWGIFYLENIV
jgi:hypothetical protein